MYSRSLERRGRESWCLFKSNLALIRGAALHGLLMDVDHYSQQARCGGRVGAAPPRRLVRPAAASAPPPRTAGRGDSLVSGPRYRGVTGGQLATVPRSRPAAASAPSRGRYAPQLRRRAIARAGAVSGRRQRGRSPPYSAAAQQLRWCRRASH